MSCRCLRFRATSMAAALKSASMRRTRSPVTPRSESAVFTTSVVRPVPPLGAQKTIRAPAPSAASAGGGRTVVAPPPSTPVRARFRSSASMGCMTKPRAPASTASRAVDVPSQGTTTNVATSGKRCTSPRTRATQASVPTSA